MEKVRTGARLLSALALLVGASTAYAEYTAKDLLKLKPKQDGVVISTPTSEEEIAACKVELIKGENGGSGYILRDGAGRLLRRFFDTNGDRYMDVWSYFLDGQEVYREIDTNFDKKVDQYRWFGPGGMKIGLDLNQDGKIDRWEAISPEEVSQEILAAVINRDFERLKALMVNDTDLKSLELPAAEIARIKEKMAGNREVQRHHRGADQARQQDALDSFGNRRPTVHPRRRAGWQSRPDSLPLGHHSLRE